MRRFSFDTIALDKGTGFRPISVEEWQALPRLARFDFILKGGVRFLQGEEVVPTKQALAEINGTETNGRSA